MPYMKSSNVVRIVLLAKKMFFIEIFQNQILKVKICHFLKPCHHSILKDNEFSFKQIHP